MATLKIYISADLEGINGIVSPEDISRGGSGYQQARQYMAEEVNAVLEGVFSGGATEALVCDAHGDSRNLLPDRIDPRAELLTGDSRKYSMVHGLDAHYDGLICLGYHAKFGTMNAILDHSYIPAIIRDIRVNGVSHGELGVNALFAAAHGVPLIMASGDQALAAETKLFDQAVETVAVKYAEGRFSARCLPVATSRRMLSEAAEKAVRSASGRRPVNVPDAPELEITFQQVNLADGAMRVKGTVRKDAFTVLIKCADMIELMATRQAVCQAAVGFYNPAF